MPASTRNTASAILIGGLGKNTARFPVDQLPSVCPICRKEIKPSLEQGRYLNRSTERASVVHQCPACQALFCAYYERVAGTVVKYRLLDGFPLNDIDYAFDPELTALSPEFVATYREAYATQQMGLYRVSGVGYRKSLEFLVKDFATRVASDEEERQWISKAPLSQVISRHIADPHARGVASRAAWLGNDETHYFRTWLDKDIDDLKQLIVITATWIAHYQKSARYIEAMPDSGPPR